MHHQLGDGPVALDRCQRHLRLEPRTVLLPCPLHVLLPRYPRFLGAGLHLSHLSHFRGPAHIDEVDAASQALRSLYKQIDAHQADKEEQPAKALLLKSVDFSIGVLAHDKGNLILAKRLEQIRWNKLSESDQSYERWTIGHPEAALPSHDFLNQFVDASLSPDVSIFQGALLGGILGPILEPEPTSIVPEEPEPTSIVPKGAPNSQIVARAAGTTKVVAAILQKGLRLQQARQLVAEAAQASGIQDLTRYVDQVTYSGELSYFKVDQGLKILNIGSRAFSRTDAGALAEAA